MSEETKQPPVKWYYKPVWLVVAILTLGPFAIPLVCSSPALKKWHKVLITVALIIVTIWLVKATVNIYHSLLKQMADLQNTLQ